MIEIKVIHEIHDVRQQHQADLTPKLVQFMEKIVAQLDDLMNVLTAVHGDVTAVLEKAKGLEAQLTQLQETTPPQVDLSAAIAAATEIRAQLEGTTSQTSDATGAAPAAVADQGAPVDDGSAGADLGGNSSSGAAEGSASSDAAGADAIIGVAGASASDADAGAGPDQNGPDGGASADDGA